MAISFQSSLGLFESALKLRSSRAEVLASNLANADTPNFKARDFDFKQALASQEASNSQNSSTSTKHFIPLNGGSGGELFYRTPTQPSIDGNTVEEQVEHTEFMQNGLEFQTAFTLLNSRFKGLMSAIKGE